MSLFSSRPASTFFSRGDLVILSSTSRAGIGLAFINSMDGVFFIFEILLCFPLLLLYVSATNIALYSALSDEVVEIAAEIDGSRLDRSVEYILDRYDRNSVPSTNLGNVALLMQDTPHT